MLNRACNFSTGNFTFPSMHSHRFAFPIHVTSSANSRNFGHPAGISPDDFFTTSPTALLPHYHGPVGAADNFTHSPTTLSQLRRHGRQASWRCSSSHCSCHSHSCSHCQSAGRRPCSSQCPSSSHRSRCSGGSVRVPTHAMWVSVIGRRNHAVPHYHEAPGSAHSIRGIHSNTSAATCPLSKAA